MSALFQSLNVEVKKTLNGLNRRPKPICTAKLSESEWRRVDDFSKRVTVDFSRRAELLLRRLDVTLESFFWNDIVQFLGEKINAIYKPRRAELEGWKPIGVEDLLGATEDVLIMERASSNFQRVDTKSRISDFKMGEAPKDRGGRTGEVLAPIRETYSQQQHSRGGRGRGGGGRFQDQRDKNFENEVKREYQNSGRGKGGERGAGGSRGRGGRRNRPY